MAYNLDPGSVEGLRNKLKTAPAADSPAASPAAPAAPTAAADPSARGAIVQTVTAAVERYLGQRAANAPPPPSREALREVVTGAVDRYLQQKPAPACGCGSKPAPQSAPATTAPACGCGVKPASASGSPAEAKPPAPPVHIVDFVCEEDVRTAIQRGKKIFIGARTIVTPSARELAAPGEILVRAER